MAEELKDWQEWKIVKQLGEGGYGKVYEIVRNRYSIEEHRALKVIRIPSSDDDVKKVMGEGMDKESTQAYYHSLVNEFIKEIAFLSEMRGSANIVTYDDYKVVERKDGVGYDILIMMELLTPLPETSLSPTTAPTSSATSASPARSKRPPPPIRASAPTPTWRPRPTAVRTTTAAPISIRWASCSIACSTITAIRFCRPIPSLSPYRIAMRQ